MARRVADPSMMSSWMRAKVWSSSRAAPASTTIRSSGSPPAPDEGPVAERRPQPLAPGQHQLPQGLEGLDQLGVDRRPPGQLLVEDGPDAVLDPAGDGAQAGRRRRPMRGTTRISRCRRRTSRAGRSGRLGSAGRARRSRRAAMAKPMAAPTPSTSSPPAASSEKWLAVTTMANRVNAG